LEGSVIFGAHVIVYSEDAPADRAFFRDVFGWATVDAGDGWLIFALPPAEAAVHPAEYADTELYLMSTDLAADVRTLESRGIRLSEVEEARWGSVTRFRLPGGAQVGLYQPSHPSPISPGPG
jgi:catechol 2,3-dioxygenase-like lactoylglutathione lyase family enzyme